MATLFINLLLIFSTVRSSLAAPALNDRRMNFSIPAVRQRSEPVLRKRQTGQTGTVTAYLSSIDIYIEYSYTCPVMIGGQSVNLVLDTGSGTSWAFSSNMPPEETEDHDIFDPRLSSTYQNLGIPFRETYTDGGGAAGELGSDNINVGGTSVQNQVFGVANEASKDFVVGPSDGILGLYLSRTLRDSNYLSFVGNAAGVLAAPLFAAYLPYKKNGAFDFGAINMGRYTGSLLSTAVDNTQSLWKVDSAAWRVGSVDYSTPGLIAVLDTGSNYLYLQHSQAKTYYDAVDKSYYNGDYGGWVYPCSQTLPSISFLIGPVNYATIPSANLITGFKSADGEICYGGVQESSNSMNVYGMLFFSAYYGVFDFATPRFSFADIVIP